MYSRDHGPQLLSLCAATRAKKKSMCTTTRESVHHKEDPEQQIFFLKNWHCRNRKWTQKYVTAFDTLCLHRTQTPSYSAVLSHCRHFSGMKMWARDLHMTGWKFPTQSWSPENASGHCPSDGLGQAPESRPSLGFYCLLQLSSASLSMSATSCSLCCFSDPEWPRLRSPQCHSGRGRMDKLWWTPSVVPVPGFISRHWHGIHH